MIYTILNDNLKPLHDFLRRLLKNEYNMTYYKESKLHIDEDLGTTIEYCDGWKYIHMYLDDDNMLTVHVFRNKEEQGKRYKVYVRCLDLYYNGDEKTYEYPETDY